MLALLLAYLSLIAPLAGGADLPGVVAGSAPAADAQRVSDASEQARWILQAQLPDGAIPASPGSTMISPYLANYAALGLGRAAQLTGSSEYAQAAWRWLVWYQAREGAHGFVSDFTVGADGEVTSRAMDSTDAYAGTFLVALQAAWRTTHDLRALRALLPGMTGALKAIETTQDSDGLTWAKPGYRVKYLIDQAEAYAGLRATAGLALEAGQPLLALRAAVDAAWMGSGVARLWDPATGAYDWALQSNGTRQPTDWSRLYPDAVAQAWAVALGLVGGARARQLMLRFEQAQPEWDDPTARATYQGGELPVGYWPAIGWAFAVVGDRSLAAQGEARIASAANDLQRRWPFNVAAAGELIALGG